MTSKYDWPCLMHSLIICARNNKKSKNSLVLGHTKKVAISSHSIITIISYGMYFYFFSPIEDNGNDKALLVINTRIIIFEIIRFLI